MASLVLVLLSLLAPTGNAQHLDTSFRPARLHAGASATQTVSLSPGVNLVSLYVLPDNPSLDVLLGGVAEHVDAVSSDDGRAYAPRHGVQSLSRWEGGRSYRIHVSADAPSPLSFDVSGARLEPETELVLAEGWNEIAYLHESPLPVDVALVSVAASLDLIEAVDGRVYPASAGRTALATLDPGHGYRIHLSRADTLVLAAAVGGRSDPDYRVATIGEALALTGLVVGDTVEVAGYAEAGDGGGGRFEVIDSGATPDGGTVFVPYEFTRETTAAGLGSDQTLFNGDGGIAFESFRLYYGPGDSEFFQAKELHGHGSDLGDDGAGAPIFEATTGRLRLPWSLRGFVENRTGSNKLSARYRYAISPRRLHRVREAIRLEGELTTRYVRPEWWGTRPYPLTWSPDRSAPLTPGSLPSGIRIDDPVYDATDEVATALNTARTHSANEVHDHYVVLRGMYGYSSIIETQDGAPLKGETDGVRDGQGLRLMKGAAWHYWARQTQTTAVEYQESIRPKIKLQKNGDPIVAIRHGRSALLARIIDLEIDGNLVENDYVLTREYAMASGRRPGSLWTNMVEERLQNGTHWNGFVTTTGAGDTVPGSNARLINVHIHDFGGNIMLSQANTHIGGSRDLRLGNSARNHIMYGMSTALEDDPITGWIDGTVEVYGYFWKGALEVLQGRYRRLVYLNPTPNPYYGYLENLISGRNRKPDPSEFGQPGNVHYFGEDVVFDNIEIHYPKGIRYRLYQYVAGPMTINNLRVTVENDGVAQMAAAIQRDQNPATSFLTIRNVEVSTGGIRTLIAGSATHARVRSIVNRGPGRSNHTMGFAIIEPRTDALHEYSFYGVSPNNPLGYGELIKLNLREFRPNEYIRVYIRDSAFKGIVNPIMIKNVPVNQTTIDRVGVYWQNVTLDNWTARNNDNGILRDAFMVQYFEGVTARGRLSEASGSTTHPASASRSHIDLQPGLFFTPYYQDLVTISNVRVNGAPDDGLITGSWTDVGTDDYQAPTGTSYNPRLRLELSRTLRDGETVTFDWRAAVNPIPSDVVFPD